MFLLGLLTGLILALFIICSLAFFRVGIERQVRIIERTIEQAGPKPEGYIVEPEDEATEAREALIKKNRQEGRDTPLSDLL